MRILNYLKPYWKTLLLLIVCTFLQVAATLELPDYTAKIINKGIVTGDQTIILGTGLQMLVVALFGGLFTVVTGFLATRVGTGFARDLRKGIFTKVEGFSLAEMNRFSTSSLITRSTNDIQQIQTVVIVILRMVLSAPITAIWAVYKAYSIAPSMSWVMALAVGVLLTTVVVLFSVAIPKFQLVQTLTDKLNKVTRENLTGIRVIRAFNKQHFEKRRMETVNTDLTRTNLFIARVTALMRPFMFLVLNLLSVGVVWFGSHLVIENALGIGDMLAFMQYAIQVIISFLLISIVFIMIPRAWVSIRRVQEILDVEPTIVDPETPASTLKARGTVEFRHVTFSYNKADTPVIQDISFIARPGETTAIIGSTGSGKSTLINLIPRFFDVEEGEVLVDNHNVKEYLQSDLRARIGFVPQRPVLFSGTVEENIAYGKETYTLEMVKKAAQIAQASEFIEAFDNKYQTNVSQSGTNLSGGQKQRISIARAIAKDPQIYIFDDTFSALDFKTELRLRHALQDAVKDKTVIIVAQRVNSILHADQIIVLDQGSIVGIGTHIELMQGCTVYQEIARSQLSEEELAQYLSDNE